MMPHARFLLVLLAASHLAAVRGDADALRDRRRLDITDVAIVEGSQRHACDEAGGSWSPINGCEESFLLPDDDADTAESEAEAQGFPFEPALLFTLLPATSLTAVIIALVGMTLAALKGDRLSVPRSGKIVGTGVDLEMAADAAAVVTENPLAAGELAGPGDMGPYEFCLLFKLPHASALSVSAPGAGYDAKKFFKTFRPKHGPAAVRFNLDRSYFDKFWSQSLPAAVSASKQEPGSTKNATKFQFQIMTCFFTDHFIRTFCGLSTMAFWGLKRNNIFVRVSATIGALREQAHDTKFLLKFDKYLDKKCKYPAHGPYSTEDSKQYLFQKYPFGDTGKCSLFRPSERLKLLHCVIDKCMDIDGVMVTKKILNASFVLHDDSVSAALNRKWNRMVCAGMPPPVNAIRDYFGSKIGLYCHFVAHYQFMMGPSGALGIGMFVFTSSLPVWMAELVQLAYAYYVAIWAAVYVSLWKQKETRKQVVWGTMAENVSATPDANRPKFKGTLVVSNNIGTVVDGKWKGKTVLYYNNYIRWVFRFVSAIVVFALVVTCMAVASTILIIKSWVKRHPKYGKAAGGVGGMGNAIQIKIFDFIFEHIAALLTELENWQTEEQHQRNCSDKIIFYRTFNTFKNFAYIAFLKRFDQGCKNGCRQLVVNSRIDLSRCPTLVNFLQLEKQSEDADGLPLDPPEYVWTKDVSLKLWPQRVNQTNIGALQQYRILGDYFGDCYFECKLNLAIIFIIMSGVNMGAVMAVKLIQPKKFKSMSRKAKVLFDAGVVARDWVSRAEFEVVQKEFDYTKSFLNVIINFGYTHFFVISFPGVSVIAWVVCYLTQIGDCFMMINGCRRPMPVAQSTVGSWIKYMGVYARIAVFTNGGMFALNTEYEFFQENRYMGLALFCLMCLLGQYIVPIVIKPKPGACMTIRRRHMNLVNSLIFDMDVLEERQPPSPGDPPAYTEDTVLDGPSDHVDGVDEGAVAGGS